MNPTNLYLYNEAGNLICSDHAANLALLNTLTGVHADRMRLGIDECDYIEVGTDVLTWGLCSAATINS